MRSSAIITGAGQGIGQAIAYELAGQGIHTYLLARTLEKLEAVAGNIRAAGGACTCLPCDITKTQEIDAALQAIERSEAVFPLILVNNAGFGGPFHRTDEVSAEEWDIIFQTNVKAAFLFCKAVLPRMKAANFGRIVNISSIFGIVGGALSSTYAASKHALIGYTKSLAVEWGSSNITCNVISPGYVNTDMGAPPDTAYYANIIRHIPGNRMGTPEEIARLVHFLVKPESGYINGANIIVDGGLLAGFAFN